MKKTQVVVGSKVRVADRIIRKGGFMKRWYKGQTWEVLALLGDKAVLSDGGPFLAVSDLSVSK